MINLVKAEIIKIIGKKSIKVSIIIVFIFMALSCVIQATSEVNDKNWREEVQSEVDFAKSEINEKKGTDMEEFYEEIYREDIVVGEYCLKNNIANNVVTPLKFTYNNTFCMTVCVILLLILAAINFSDEYQYGTIKQILTRPYKRSRILCIKQMVFSVASVVVLFEQMLISYFVGCVFFGKNKASYIAIEYIEGKIVEVDMRSSIIQTFLAYVVITVFLIAMVYLLITIFHTLLLPVMITVIVWMSSNIVSDFLSKYEIVKYTFLPHLDLKQYIAGNELVRNDNNIVLSLVVLTITYCCIQVLTFTIFNKRDI